LNIAGAADAPRPLQHLLSGHALLTGKNFPSNYRRKKSKGAVQ
jgi:hypothetical protein